MNSNDGYYAGYMLPGTQRHLLTSMPDNGDAISIVDGNMVLDRGAILRFCGQVGYIGVRLDVYHQQEEVNEGNNEVFIDFTVVGCPG